MADEKTSVDLYCVSMPKSQYGFIQKNEELAKMVGMAILALAKLDKAREDVKKHATNIEIMRPYMKEGTDEELAAFLKASFDSADAGIVAFNDLPEEVAQQVQEEMGENLVVTHINEKKA